MGVRLLAPFERGAWRVNRPLVCVFVTDLLGDEVLDQGAPLFRRQLAGQGNFYLAIGRAIRALVLVGGGPKMRRVMHGPPRHVAVRGRLQIFIARLAAVLALAGNVRGMRAGLAFAADFDCAVV